MAIGGKRFWLGTWNCENQAPDPAGHLGTFVTTPVTAAGAAGPDLLFLGFQEVDTKNFGEFPHERLAKAKGGRLGAAYTLPQGGTVSSQGMTKGTINHQALGMLVKNGAAVTEIESGQYSHRGGKGGLFLTFKYEGHAFAVISAHLESKGAQHQNKEIDELMTKVATRGKTVSLKRFHTVFIMGDLNYRIAGDQATAPSTARVADAASGLQVHAYAGANEVIPRTMLGEDMAATILSAQGRRNLLRYDQLKDSALVKKFGFQFPVPSLANGDPSYPTYKREYKVKPAVPNFINTRSIQRAMAAYCLPQGQDMETSAERGHAYEIGWLDRIGYIAQAAPASVTVQDCEAVNLSDHSPVMMRYTF